MRVQHIRLLLAALVVLSLLAVGACKKDEPEKPAPADVPAQPAVEVLDLDRVQQTLAAPGDAAAAVNALVELAKALETPGAIPEGQEARAKELKTVAGFSLLAGAALGTSDADVKQVANALALEAPDDLGARSALAAFGAQVGAETPTGKAAAVVAWLTAPTDERAAMQAPDLATWRSLVKDDAPAGVAVRAATLEALQGALQPAEDGAAAPAASRFARALGPVLCADCAALPETEGDAVSALLYDPANRGYVCPSAGEKLAEAAPWAYPQTIAASCHPSDYGLAAPDEMDILTAGNALALRALAIALEAQQLPKDEKNPLTASLQAKRAAVEPALDALTVPLALPWLPVPADVAAEAAPAVRPPAHATGPDVRRPAPPLETFVVSEDGIAMAIRPVAAVRQGAIVREDKAVGLAWPGKQLIAADAVAASDEKRDAAAKEAGEEIADRDVIGEVVDGAVELQQQASPITERALRSAPEALRNDAREGDRRAALVAVDTAAPAWLFRRALASLRSAGYRFPLLPRADADDLSGERVLPVVFRTADELPKTVVDRRFERPILVVVGEDKVEVFPPYKRLPEEEKEDEAGEDEAAEETAKAEGAEAAASEEITFPKEAKRVLDPNERLYTFEIPLPDDGGPVGPAVAQTIRKLGQDSEAGDLVYVIADDAATSGRVVEVVGAIATIPGEPLAALDAVEPGLACGEGGCPARLAVLFPGVSRPRMPAKRKQVKKAPPKKRDERNASGPAGFCSKGNIRKVVTRRSGSFRFCYEKELQLHPDLKGKIVVQFTIGRDGTVPKATIRSSTIRNRKVEQCVLKAFRGMRFDKPQGGICVVNWPLQFR